MSRTETDAAPAAPALDPEELRVSRLRAVRGPNFWRLAPVIACDLRLGSLEDVTSDLIPGFTDRLLEAVPTLQEHPCSRGERGGFVERLREGTHLPHVLEHVALELQTLAGSDVSFGRVVESGDEGVWWLIVAYEEEDVGLQSVRDAVRLVRACIAGEVARRAGDGGGPARPPGGRAAGALHRGHRGGGAAARHPGAAAQQLLAGAAGAGEEPAPHPGGHVRLHQRHRGGDRAGQGRHPPRAAQHRPPRAGGRHRHHAGRGHRGGARDRLPGAAQAAGRQPRARDLRPPGRRRGHPPGVAPRQRLRAAGGGGAASSPGATTGCWWWTGRWWRWRSASPRTWWATGAPPCAS